MSPAPPWTRRAFLDVARSGGGLPPRRWHRTVGRVALGHRDVLAVAWLGLAPTHHGWRYEVVVWADALPDALDAVAAALRTALPAAVVRWQLASPGP